jgi:hypothetical protein
MAEDWEDVDDGLIKRVKAVDGEVLRAIGGGDWEVEQPSNMRLWV